jgi:hypothetical protein
MYSHGAKYCNFPMRHKAIFVAIIKGVTIRYFDESTYYNVLSQKVVVKFKEIFG